MALVFVVKTFLISFNERQKVWGSIPAKLIFPPSLKTDAPVEKKVSMGTITSSSCFNPRDRNEISRAAEQEFVATAKRTPQ